MKFEEALKRLEEIVNELENYELELERSIELFEEGMRLVRICEKMLDEAQEKVEILIREGEEFKTEPFGEDEF